MLATTRRVSGQVRVKLTRELGDEFGLELLDVHDQAEFVALLYRSSKWRRDLLGAPGTAGTLTRVSQTAPPTPPTPLIGRKR